MSASPTGSAWFRPSSFAGALAYACSIASSLLLLLLLPPIYIGFDLLANRGQISNPASIPATVSFLEASAGDYLQQASNGQVGLLATIVRNDGHWTQQPLAAIASFLPSTWNNEGLLAWLIGSAVVIVFLRAIFVNAAAHFASLAAIDATQRLRRDLYQHCFRINALAVDRRDQDEAGRLMTDRAEALQDGWIAARTTMARTTTLVVLATAALLAVHPAFGLAILCLGGFVWFVAGQSAAWARRDARRAERRSGAVMEVVRESLRLLLVVKCNLMDRFSQNRVERQVRELAKAARRQYRGAALGKPVLLNMAAVASLVLAYFAARMILAGSLSLAAVAVQAGCAVALTFAVLRWLAGYVQSRKARGAVAEIAEFFDRRTDASQDIDAKFLQPIAEKLDVLEVSYREPGTGAMILEGVSFSVPVGQRLAVICSDAAATKVISHLLARFLEPTAGEIRIDGKNTRWVTYESLRTQIGLVLPDHTTFSDTVANNIGCGDSFSLPKIVEAAKLAHAHGLIQHLPYGYETPIGDGGTMLRPGERYRIALARALLREPSILILEEPAEPFDPDSAALIDDTLARLHGRYTVIVLARRSTTIKKADRVSAIVDGKSVSASQAESHVSGSQLSKALADRRSQSGASSA